MRLLRFTIDTHMKLFFAGATRAGLSRLRQQIRVTLKTPLLCSEAIQNKKLQEENSFVSNFLGYFSNTIHIVGITTRLSCQ
jgi:hypothetical protein